MAPLIYYKYRQFDNRAFEILLNRELWFATPGAMNDPLDCQIPLDKILQAVINSSQDGELRNALVALRDWTVRHTSTNAPIRLNDSVNDLIRGSGVLTLSKCATEALMWSHYGGGHKGICIGFAASFFDGLLKDHKTYGLVGAQDVEYAPVPLFQDFFEGNAMVLSRYSQQEDQSILDKFRSDYIFELIVASLLTKSARWSYEEEYRVVKSKPGSLKFPSAAVKEIIFGMKATDRDVDTVRNILFSNDWRHVQYKRTKFQTRSFEMTLSDI